MWCCLSIAWYSLGMCLVLVCQMLDNYLSIGIKHLTSNDQANVKQVPSTCQANSIQLIGGIKQIAWRSWWCIVVNNVNVGNNLLPFKSIFLPSSCTLPTHVASRLCSTFFTMETSWSITADLRARDLLKSAWRADAPPWRCSAFGSDRIPASI